MAATKRQDNKRSSGRR